MLAVLRLAPPDRTLRPLVETPSWSSAAHGTPRRPEDGASRTVPARSRHAPIPCLAGRRLAAGSARPVTRAAGSGPGGGLSGGGAAGDPVGQVGSVFVDEAEQGRAAAALPGQAEEVQAGDIGDAAPVDYVPVTDYAGDVYPGVVRAVTGGPDHDAGVQAAAVGEPDGAVRAGHCGRNRTPAIRSRRRLLPMTKSGRARSRRPSRDPAVTRIRPSRVSHQNRSLPASRCGSTGALVAIDRSTWRVAASSSAIWNRSCRRPPPAQARAATFAGCGIRRCAIESPSRRAAARPAAHRAPGTGRSPPPPGGRGRHHHRSGPRSPPPSGSGR